MRQKITEEQLHRIVKESVKNVLIQEGFMNNVRDKFQGASRGWSQGYNQTEANEWDVNNLQSWVRRAQMVLKDNNPQEALEFLNNFIRKATTGW